MPQAHVPLTIVTDREENVEVINRTLREAGHPVRCHWVKQIDDLAAALEQKEPELIWVFADMGRVADAAQISSTVVPMVPLLVVAEDIPEAVMAQTMRAGARDVVSLHELERLRSVAERELRTFRLERALNETLVSATQYKKQLKAFMASSEDAIAHAQEGILVDANPSWAKLFDHPDIDAMRGLPLMDFFDASSQAALKGALVACAKGQWPTDPLRVAAILADGSTAALEMWLESEEHDGEPAVKLSVLRAESTRAEPEQLVENMVHKDPTTGFYHRRRFIELLTERLETKSQGGVRVLAYLRPDRFGQIKDEVGPLATEDILVQLAEIIRGLMQPNDLYGRFGGVVFTLLLERGTLRDVEAWAENAVTAIADHMFEVEKHTLSVTCTMGLSEVTPGSDKVKSLITDAERANNRGRKRGGNQVVLAEVSDESTRIKRFDAFWVMQIESALAENRFRLVQLPIASLSGESFTLYDTVLRMVDQQGDEVPASEFIQAATRRQLLKAIDRWVIGASFSLCQAQQPDRVFVKLSRESLIDPTLVDWLGKHVEAAGIDAGKICLQAAETDAAQHLKQTKALIDELRASGFTFAIEHFGVGRNPMQMLGSMPMDYLKIDGSLMQSLSSNQTLQETVRGYIEAARERKIASIAERVEDANTMAVLFQLGVGYVQGHYLHEPEVILEAS